MSLQKIIFDASWLTEIWRLAFMCTTLTRLTENMPDALLCDFSRLIVIGHIPLDPSCFFSSGVYVAAAADFVMENADKIDFIHWLWLSPTREMYILS